MPDFSFQQYASRGVQGYGWLPDRLQPPAPWLQEFESVLSRVLPADGRNLGAARTGGVYLSATGDFAALFAFCPAEADYFGRPGGIVTNVLFCKATIQPVPSLKRAWEHPCLKANANESVPAIVFISLDQDFGDTSEQRHFFGVLQDWQHDKPLLMKYSDSGTACHMTTVTPPSVTATHNAQDTFPKSPTVSEGKPQSHSVPLPTQGNSMQEPLSSKPTPSKSHSMRCFILGVVLGIVTAFAVQKGYRYLKGTSAPKDAQKNRAVLKCAIPETLDFPNARFNLRIDCEKTYDENQEQNLLLVHKLEITLPEAPNAR